MGRLRNPHYYYHHLLFFFFCYFGRMPTKSQCAHVDTTKTSGSLSAPWERLLTWLAIDTARRSRRGGRQPSGDLFSFYIPFLRTSVYWWPAGGPIKRITRTKKEKGKKKNWIRDDLRCCCCIIRQCLWEGVLHIQFCFVIVLLLCKICIIILILLII